MKHYFKSFSKRRKSILIIFIFLSVVFPVRLAVGQQVQSKESSGKLIELKVSAPSLKGNLLGDSIEQKAVVYLPPSYETSPTKRFPTLYLLHGFNGKIEHWTKGGYQGMSLQPTIDGLIKSGAVSEMIVGDQFGIHLVGFGACQTARGKSFDLRRINDADGQSGIKQMNGEGFAVSAGRFQTNVQTGNRVRVKPNDELLKPVCRISKDFMFGFAVFFD